MKNKILTNTLTLVNTTGFLTICFVLCKCKILKKTMATLVYCSCNDPTQSPGNKYRLSDVLSAVSHLKTPTNTRGGTDSNTHKQVYTPPQASHKLIHIKPNLYTNTSTEMAAGSFYKRTKAAHARHAPGLIPRAAVASDRCVSVCADLFLSHLGQRQ